MTSISFGAHTGKRWLEASDAVCKFRFEQLDSLRLMPADQRERLTPEAAELEALLQDITWRAIKKC